MKESLCHSLLYTNSNITKLKEFIKRIPGIKRVDT